MFSLGEIQFANLLAEINAGAISLDDLVALDNGVYQIDGDTLVKRVDTYTPEGASKVRSLLIREAQRW